MKQLKVILLEHEVGVLEQKQDGRISFAYSVEWLKSEHARPLSVSLPLREDAFDERRCAPFFGGLLPEEHNREIVAANLGITAKNDFAMLREIGGECAGAVSLIPIEKSPTSACTDYEIITEADLIALLDQLPQRPLLAGKAEIRLSLAGAQSKVALRVTDSGYALPLNESPSTHIIKPQLERFLGLVDNEAYCLKLAAAAGLNTCDARPKQFGSHQCLLVTRYDRTFGKDTIGRHHQEDFCQALGISSRTKYQNEGGPGLADCFNLVRAVSANPAKDLIQLFNAVLFNYLIGNNDAHGKNFSLLYESTTNGHATRLAPFYDLASTAIYPELSAKMAMKIGKAYQPDALRLSDWEAAWNGIGFSKSQARKQALQFANRCVACFQTPENEIQAKVQKIASDRSAKLQRSLA